MSGELVEGVELLERAVGYTLGALSRVTKASLCWPTPCTGWNLRALLRHLDDSLDVLSEGAETGGVRPVRGALAPAEDVVASVRVRAGAVLGAWAGFTGADGDDHALAVGDLPLMASCAAGVGALEIAVHGWDISRTLGLRRPMPPELATDLLEIARLTVGDTGRHPLFATAVPVPPHTRADDRLAAYLGRDPSR
ncbi:TIGR03086 family metal-binding protein [Actinomadura sp. SCN-SB]|uniref:TIGR03086 family metal-binding protein n=1 Tax=Actinomadura sp. SCN-SB TaxID=3373092 RepID=UPI003751152B